MTDRTADSTESDGDGAAAYLLAVRTAWVAGVFSVVVAGMLLAGFTFRQGKDPLDSQKYLAMKANLRASPDDDALKQDIRALDLNLRRDYFRLRRFTELGTWLLLGGTLVFLAAAKTTSVLRRKLPSPGPHPGPVDRDTRRAGFARVAVAVVAAFVAGTVFGLAVGYRPVLPERAEDLPAEAPPERPERKTPPGEGPVEPAAEQPAEPPLAEGDLANWPRFRGPGGLGVSDAKDLPTAWNDAKGEGIRWKTAVPLPGNNSPVVWQTRIFLSGATEEKREVYCFDADSGEVLWQKPVPPTPEGSGEPPEVMEDTGFAASTMATDGRRAFAIFPNGDVTAFDFEGNNLWTRGFGVPENSYGHASSLALHEELLLVQMDQGGKKDKLSKLLALDVATGKTVWETPREVPSSWTTPIVIRVGDRPQIITAANPFVIAYNPGDGREIWRAKYLDMDVGPSPTFADGIVYVANDFPGLAAIKADGTGDVTETNILWEGEDGLPNTASPLVTGEFVLLATTDGMLTCYDAKEGTFLWDKEFLDTVFQSSPSLAEGRVYLFGGVEVEQGDDWVKKGKAWVLEVDRDGAEEIGTGDFEEGCVTSPAFQDGRIYIRGKQHLFCIGQ